MGVYSGWSVAAGRGEASGEKMVGIKNVEKEGKSSKALGLSRSELRRAQLEAICTLYEAKRPRV